MTVIREARDADAATVAEMLTAAFADDPAFCWIFPDAATRRRRMPALFAALFAGDAGNGTRLLTEEGAAASLWRAPGHARDDLRGPLQLWQAWRLLGGAQLRGKRVADAIAAHFPSEPFWYLHIAACHPAHQGRGLGRAIIAAGLARSDGLPVYLETANRQNLSFYQSLGFRVSDEWCVPGCGPRFWSMIRPQD